MRALHILMAIAVMAAWGFNFVVIKIGLDSFPPLLLNALRFGLAGLPVIFIWKSRPTAFIWIATIALTLGVFKFGLLFIGMNLGAAPGLSSLTLQSQALFTVLLAFILFDERPSRRQLVGMGLAIVGLALIINDVSQTRGTLTGLLFVILAAFCWGVTNIAMKKAQSKNPLHLMIWVSAFSAPVLFVLSLIFEGVPNLNVGTSAVLSVFYLSFVATLAGFGVWAWLLKNYSASTVAPFSLLVPFFGMSSSALVTGEELSAQVLIAAGFILCGLYLNSVQPGFWKRKKQPC